MDGTMIDRLFQRCGRAGSRRGLLGLLAALPLVAAGLRRELEDTAAAGRRQRRKKRHKHQQGDGKRHRKGEQKGDAKRKRRCAALGHAPGQTRQACCTGLSLDSSGRCAAPTSPPTLPSPCSGDAECDDGNACTLDTCQSGACQHLPAAAGTACTRGGGGAGICDAVGRCSRQVVTRTFANTAPITIPAGRSGVTPAALYPSKIDVNGLTNGVITDVNIHLNGYRSALVSYPQDVDILLSALHLPGLNAIIMSDASNVPGAYSNVNLVLDDQAATPLPETGGLDSGSGTFQPANYGGGLDAFPSPAPTPSGNSQLSTFNGQNPNDTWQLWVVDDVGGLSPWGLEGGWALEITAEVDA
jgi:hypothetical protein